jgi:glycosyltransferase involved in cell wall biosynthesis/putative flippase GtrA
MKVISISNDRKILEENSAIRRRMVEYGKLFERMDMIVFSKRNFLFPISNFQLSDKVYVYPTNSRNRLMYLFDSFRIIRKLILNPKLKIENCVVTTQDPYETGFVGLLLKLFYRIPLQIQVHTDFANRYFITHSLLNMIRFGLAEIILSFADSVRVVSRRIARSVHNDPKYVSVLPIYAEVRNTKHNGRKDHDKITFLTVGRLEREKDVSTAIKAFKKVLDSGIVAEFVIVGEGSERKYLELLAEELQIKEKVIFTGWQDPNEYYKHADVYLSTSLYEGYGLAIVEAAMHSLPLVISDAGVAGELFRDEVEALICRQRDEEAFARAMRRLALPELRERMGELAKGAAVQSQISYDEYLEKYNDSVVSAITASREGGSIFRKNILLRYLVAGLSGAGVNISLVFIFTHYFKVIYIYSSGLAFLLSIAISFALQKFWTFGERSFARVHRQFARYMLMALLGLLVNTISMYVLVEILLIWYILAQVITNAFIAVFNFITYRFFIFHKKI